MSDLTLEFNTNELTLEFPGPFPYSSPDAQAIANPGTVAVAAGRSVLAVAINSAVGDRVVSLGTTLGGTDIWDSETITSGQSPFKYVGVYFQTGGTLYFSGATLSARIILL